MPARLKGRSALDLVGCNTRMCSGGVRVQYVFEWHVSCQSAKQLLWTIYRPHMKPTSQHHQLPATNLSSCVRDILYGNILRANAYKVFVLCAAEHYNQSGNCKRMWPPGPQPCNTNDINSSTFYMQNLLRDQPPYSARVPFACNNAHSWINLKSSKARRLQSLKT